MDHRPVIQNPVYPLDDVPFLVKDPRDQYNGPSLIEFAERSGFVLGKHLDKEIEDEWTVFPMPGHIGLPETVAKKASFIQAWLFFGPLFEIFSTVDIEVHTADFVRESNGVQLITTSRLPDLTTKWVEAEDCLSDPAAKEIRSKRIHEVLDCAEILVQKNLCYKGSYEVQWVLPEVVLISIYLLLDALTHAWGAIYAGAARSSAVAFGGEIWFQLAESRMRAQGWCASEIAVMPQMFSATGRYFASMLSRRAFSKFHDACDKVKCVSSQVDNVTYITRHIGSHCDCVHVPVDVPRVKHILDNGSIPLIRIHPEANQGEPVELTVEAFGPYVAISHVWFQGLGNARANALPTCQLSRIRQLALDLIQSAGELAQEDGSILVWIDTLCVPLGEGRKQALRLMGQTYTDATCVLVLDEELCHQSFQLFDRGEGYLAGPRLFVQFREGARRYLDLCPDYQPVWHSPLLFHSLRGAWSILAKHYGDSLDQADRLVLASDACKYRTTSWLPDETFCLAEVAGLAADSILEHDTQDARMRALLLECKQIPADVIFFDGPRLQESGFRWAPYSFLHPLPSSSILSGDRTGTCTTKGLTASWPSYMLTFPTGCSYTHVTTYYFRANDRWMIIYSPEVIERDVQMHNQPPESMTQLEKFRQLHSAPQCALILTSSELPYQRPAIISIAANDERCHRTGAFAAEFVVSMTIALRTDDDVWFIPDFVDPIKAILIQAVSLGDTTWRIS